MADAQASGACVGNNVWVQVPSPALLEGRSNDLPFSLSMGNGQDKVSNDQKGGIQWQK